MAAVATPAGNATGLGCHPLVGRPCGPLLRVPCDVPSWTDPTCTGSAPLGSCSGPPSRTNCIAVCRPLSCDATLPPIRLRKADPALRTRERHPRAAGTAHRHARESREDRCFARSAHATAHSQYLESIFDVFAARLRAVEGRPHNDRCLPPGWHFKVRLRAEAAAVRVGVTYLQGAHKMRERADAMTRNLIDIVEAHTSPLLSELTKLEPPWVDLFFTTSDWILPNEHLLLPLLSLATSERSSVLAVPDWSFTYNAAISPEEIAAKAGVHLDNSSWAEVSRWLLGLSNGTRQRLPAISWRGAENNQPHMLHQLPQEQKRRRSVGLLALARDTHALARLGVRNDVRSSSGAAPQMETTHTLRKRVGASPGAASASSKRFLRWDESCRNRYQLQLDGFGGSYSLKYRLACGAVVFRQKSLNPVGRNLETLLDWWEAAAPLTAGVHFISLETNLSRLVPTVAELESEPRRAEAISAAAADYVRTYLSAEATECYVFRLLLKYIQHYATYRRKCAAAEQEANSDDWIAESAARPNPHNERLGGCYPFHFDPCYMGWAGVRARPPNGSYHGTYVPLPPIEYDIAV